MELEDAEEAVEGKTIFSLKRQCKVPMFYLAAWKQPPI